VIGHPRAGQSVHQPGRHPPEPRAAGWLRAATEVVVLAVVALTPWAFGGVDPAFELALAAGVALVAVLWAAAVAVEGRLVWVRCPLAMCLAGLTLLGLLQLVPVPPAVHRAVAPGLARLWDDLLPAAPEVVAAGDAPPPAPAARPLTAYPYATRAEVARWLGVFVLFAAVRTRLASTAALRRLSAVMLVNGALLALLGLTQFFSSGRTKLYWRFDADTSVFGPFIYPNHFACYMNLCLALGAGILLSAGGGNQRTEDGGRRTGRSGSGAAAFSPFDVLRSPAQAWASLAVALMLAGLVCSTSRGGVAALAVALAVVLAVRLTAGAAVRRLDLLVVPAVLLVGLLAWVGVRPLEGRLATLWRGEAIGGDVRWEMWRSLLGAVRLAPATGIGYGVLPHVEPALRTRRISLDPEGTTYVIDRAHNDYLDAAVEGGVVRLGLTVALAVLAVRAGVRAVRRHAGRRTGGLAAGALLAVLALALHALIDFQLSTPAIAALAAVVAAHLAALDRDDPTAPPAADPRALTLRLGVPGRVVAAAALLAIGGLLVAQFWQADRVHRLRLAAWRAVRAQPPDDRRAAELLTAATRVAPENAELHVELGQVYLDARQRELARREPSPRDHAGLAAAAVGAGFPLGAAALVGAGAVRDEAAADPRLREAYVRPALREMIRARDLCPLLAKPHMRLAAYAPALARSDPPEAYWARARRLAPFDADLWYFSGVYALRDGRPDDAWAFWRRALELSDKRLAEIVTAAAGRLPTEQLPARVLPDDPALLLTAARRLDTTAARPLLARAVELIDARPRRGWPEERARFHALNRLDRFEDATRAARAALEFKPDDYDLRVEFARFLGEHRAYDEAYKELLYVKRYRPTSSAEFEEFFRLIDRLKNVNR
jgi:O-antigen ligase